GKSSIRRGEKMTKNNEAKIAGPSIIDKYLEDLGITKEDLETQNFLTLEKKIGINPNHFGDMSVSEDRQGYPRYKKIITHQDSINAQYAYIQKSN
ncbi:MAG: hypothetical protein NTY99_01515, partial [DPANN group archaeon]|nr:hypothetical protein [DPANN group archaeon]